MPKQLPIHPGQRPAFKSVMDKAIERVSKLDPASIKLRATEAEKLVAEKLPVAWSLPAGPAYSCPGATADCAACYAQQGRHYYPNVAEKLARNWRRFRWMEEHQTPAQAAREIVRDVISPILSLFRIHESGDFHSQWAVDVWTQVIAMKPMTAFWSYTRSFQLDFSRLVALPNVRLYASTDSQNLGAARAFVAKHGGRVAHAFGPYVPGARLPARSYECPPTADKHLVKLGKKRTEFGLSGACVRCRACIPFEQVEKPRHIVFYSHYLSQATTGYPDGGPLEGLDGGEVRRSIGRAVMAPGLGPGCMTNSADPFHFP